MFGKKKTALLAGCREHLNKGRWEGFDAVLHYSKGAHTGILQGLPEASGRHCKRLDHARACWKAPLRFFDQCPIAFSLLAPCILFLFFCFFSWKLPIAHVPSGTRSSDLLLFSPPLFPPLL